MKRQAFVISAILILSMSFSVSFATDFSKTTEIVIPLAEPTEPFVGTDRFVIFAQSQSDYEGLLSLFDVNMKFDNLRAAILDLSGNQYSVAKELYGSHVYRISDLEPFTIQKSETPNAVEFKPDGILTTQAMKVTDLYAMGYTGQGINVGIIDNGIDLNHTELQGKVVQQVFVGGTKIDYNHGTPVAGMIVANGIGNPDAVGTAKDAKIYSVGLSSTPEGSFTFETMMLGFNEMLKNKQQVRIVNISIGGQANIFEEIARIYAENNVQLVSSAGNSGPSGHTVGFPGGEVDTISVGATTVDKALASFSSRGPVLVRGPIKPDVVAPGAAVLSTALGGGYTTTSGTSFSSPATAGALATLASALNAQGIEWNIGTLKAALIRGAEGDCGNYTYGMGFVNIKKSYDYVLSVASGSTAKTLAVTPIHANFMRTKFIQNQIYEVPGFTVISSHLSEVKIEITGTISSILKLNTSALDLSRYSTELPLYADTNGAALGQYSGDLVISVGREQLKIPMNVEVIAQKGKVAFDIWHTDLDSTIENIIPADLPRGTNTGWMIELFHDNGFVVDVINETLTSSLLQGYDILWIPDPVPARNNPVSIFYPYSGAYFSDAEIDAIVQYVDDGGNLLTTFNGLMTIESKFVGTNATEVNKLLTRFGVKTSVSSVPAPISVSISTVNNVTSLTKGVKSISTYGNFLSVNASKLEERNSAAYALTGDLNKSQIIAIDKIGAGRVIVSDNNLWTDNFGLTGDPSYSPYDFTLAQNAINWFMQKERVTLMDYTMNSSYVEGHVVAYSGSTPLTSLSGTATISGGKSIALTLTSNGNGNFSFSYDASTEDGIHNVAIHTSEDYVNFKFINNLLPPTVTPNFENGTVFPADVSSFDMNFTVVDSIYQPKTSDITITVDGVVRSASLFPRSISGNTLTVKILTGLLDANIVEHVIQVSVKDQDGLTGTAAATFKLGNPSVSKVIANDPIQLPDNFEVRQYILSGYCENSYSLAPVSTTPTTTTTSEATTSLTTSETEDNGLNVAMLFVMIGFATMVIFRKKHSK